jgi:hypothetical protein
VLASQAPISNLLLQYVFAILVLVLIMVFGFLSYPESEQHLTGLIFTSAVVGSMCTGLIIGFIMGVKIK